MSAEAAIVTSLLETGGPTVAAVAVLWYRMNRLEQRVDDRLRGMWEPGPPPDGREARWREKWSMADGGDQDPPS